MLIKAVYSYQLTRQHNPEESRLHGRRCDKLKFHFWNRLHKTGALTKKWRNYLTGKSETELPPLNKNQYSTKKKNLPFVIIMPKPVSVITLRLCCPVSCQCSLIRATVLSFSITTRAKAKQQEYAASQKTPRRTRKIKLHKNWPQKSLRATWTRLLFSVC